MGSRGPKLVNVTLVVRGKKHPERVELYNIPESDAKEFQQKLEKRRQNRGPMKARLMPIDGRNTDGRSFKLDLIESIDLVPC